MSIVFIQRVEARCISFVNLDNSSVQAFENAQRGEHETTNGLYDQAVFQHYLKWRVFRPDGDGDRAKGAFKRVPRPRFPNVG